MADTYSPSGSGQPGQSSVMQSDTANQPNGFSNDSDAAGRRVRLRPKPAAALEIYGGSGLLQPLRATNGLVWPYQPQITFEQTVEYQSIDLVHVNQEILAYNRTPALKMTVNGGFSVQNQQEGIYALAAIHFLRTVTKMYFGSGANLGTPPPVLLFDAYGQYMFNQLPVLVTQFSYDLPIDVDYVPIDLSNIQAYSSAQSQTNIPGFSQVQTTPQLQSFFDVTNSALMTSRMFKSDLQGQDGYVWLPAVFNLSVGLTVQNTPSRLRQFNLDSFRTGELMKQGRWI